VLLIIYRHRWQAPHFSSPPLSECFGFGIMRRLRESFAYLDGLTTAPGRPTLNSPD